MITLSMSQQLAHLITLIVYVHPLAVKGSVSYYHWCNCSNRSAQIKHFTKNVLTPGVSVNLFISIKCNVSHAFQFSKLIRVPHSVGRFMNKTNQNQRSEQTDKT